MFKHRLVSSAEGPSRSFQVTSYSLPNTAHCPTSLYVAGCPASGPTVLCCQCSTAERDLCESPFLITSGLWWPMLSALQLSQLQNVCRVTLVVLSCVAPWPLNLECQSEGGRSVNLSRI